MWVLVACEFSGRVRDAFIRAGHAAWSCDLLPSETDGPHFQCDVREIVNDREAGYCWDLLIAHPPCTALTVAGNRWYHDKPDLIKEAFDFVLLLANAKIKHICIENPVGRLSSLWRKPDQYIQPWQFGHPESKKTGLWLKDLPLLKPTNVLARPESGRWENQTPSGQNNLGPSKDRWKDRSRTYQGIADAMASQWSVLQ